MTDITRDADIFRERLRDLFTRYHGFVRRACKRYVQNRDDAEDLAQEVILKAAGGWDRFGGEARADTWLYRVAANHCVDHLRRVARRARLAQRFAEDSRPHGAPGIGEAEEAVADLLAGLGDVERRILRLGFEDGLDQEGIARAVGLSRAGVVRRLRNIRRRALRLREAAGT